MKANSFKVILATSASIAAMVLATQAFAGNGNEVYVTQSHPTANNDFTATQDGNYNLIGAQHQNFGSVVYYFRQGGGGSNTADLYQKGNHNKIGYDASGSPEAAFYPGTTFLGQSGNGNAVAVYQQGSGGGDNGYNRLGILTQTGAGNDATLAQTGDRNQVESLTQNGGSTGGHNIAKVTQLGSDNGGTGVTVPFYIADLLAAHSVDEVNPTPPPAHIPFVVSPLGVDGVNLNALANLDQAGSYNLAMLGFEGNGNRFNVTQLSDEGAAHYAGGGSGTDEGNTFLAGKNGRDVKSGAASLLSNLAGDGNYIYGYQNGSGNSVALSGYGAVVNNAVFLVSQSGVGGVGTTGFGNEVEWTIKSGATFEAIQLGDDNTVTGGQTGCCLPSTVLTYQTGSGNTITAMAGNGTYGSLIDLYQQGTSNWFYAKTEGGSQVITGTQIGMSNVADVRQYGSGNTINISQH